MRVKFTMTNSIRKGLPLLLGLLSVAVQASYQPKEVAQPRNEFSQTGKVHFVGGLLSTPCSLSVESQEQWIELGNTAASQFRHQGDRGPEVRFSLNFKDCLMGASGWQQGAESLKYPANSLAYTTGEQLVAFSFAGVPNDENVELLKLNGALGMGLRLRDAMARPVPLNQRINSFFLQPGDNTLTFSASLESTRKYVQADYIDAVVNINVYYF